MLADQLIRSFDTHDEASSAVQLALRHLVLETFEEANLYLVHSLMVIGDEHRGSARM
jgi:hypothetical protein